MNIEIDDLLVIIGELEATRRMLLRRIMELEKQAAAKEPDDA